MEGRAALIKSVAKKQLGYDEKAISLAEQKYSKFGDQGRTHERSGPCQEFKGGV